MITKGFVLNSLYNGKHQYVLACSENDKELEDKKIELIRLHSEKRERFRKAKNIQEEYYKIYQKEVSNTENSNYETKDFVTKNPVPDEIKEFVRYSEDRGSGNLYFYSDRDFEVRYWITNILGFK